MVCVSDPRLCWFMFRSDPRLPHYFGDLPLPLFLLWSHLLDHSDSDSGLVSSPHDFNLSRSSATLPIWSFQPTCSIGDSPLRTIEQYDLYACNLLSLALLNLLWNFHLYRVGELQLHFGYMDWIEIITCALTMDCSNNLGHDDLDPMGSSAFL